VKESTRDVTNVTRHDQPFWQPVQNTYVALIPLAMEELLMGADGWVAGLV
jgi:dihydrodipicolinate synthase/N-acetylneuraminate lyase